MHVSNIYVVCCSGASSHADSATGAPAMLTSVTNVRDAAVVSVVVAIDQVV